MREFHHPVKSTNDEESHIGEPVTIKIDGREVAFLPPTSAQMAMPRHELLSWAPVTGDRQHQLLLFDWMESDDDRRHFSRRLFSRKDEFDEGDGLRDPSSACRGSGPETPWNRRPPPPPRRRPMASL